MLTEDADFDLERVELFHDAATGVTGVVAIDSTTLGPAMGGLRLYAYDTFGGAIADAQRLAKAMSLKNAAAGLGLGGGKAVLLDDGGWAEPVRRAERMRAVGRVVDELGGRYVTAEDVGTTPQDMDDLASATRWVAGRPAGSGGTGDPSPATARTVFGAILAAARQRLGVSDLAGVSVGVQGVGHVGAALVGLLAEADADLVLTDALPERAALVAERHGARAVEPAGFLRRDLDVLAPCALGGVIASPEVATLRCAVVAGAANNPLEGPRVAAELDRQGILYVPDFLANCGGIIHVGSEVLGFGADEVERLTVAAIERTDALLRDAQKTGRTPWDVAVAFARERIAAGPGAPVGAAA